MDELALHDHLVAPRGRGRLPDSPHYGAAGGAACGDLVRIAVRVDGDRLVEAGRLAVGPDAGVERVLLGGETAYALTWRGVIAADPASLRHTGSAAFGG